MSDATCEAPSPAPAETPCVCVVCGGACDDGHVETWEGSERIAVACNRCDANQNFDRYAQTGVITSRLVAEVGQRHYDLAKGRTVDPRGRAIERADEVFAVWAALDRIKADVRAFEQEVWYGGLQAAARGSKTKGMKARARRPFVPRTAPTLLSYTIAGRAMVTLEDDAAQVTLITDENTSRVCMGLQGIRATEAQARKLLRGVIEAWARGELVMKEDREVSVL